MFPLDGFRALWASNSFSNTEAGDNGQSEMTPMTRDRLRRPDWAFHI